jgi:hypothetical protein
MILVPAIWAVLAARGMTRADLATCSEEALIGTLLALDDEAAAQSDNPFRDVLTPALAALVARRLKAAAA